MECMRQVQLSILRPTTNPLRPVNERSIEFEELQDSIAECGILQPLLVRPSSTIDRYEVVDGMHRYRAAQNLNFDSVPCIIKEMTDEEVLKYQIETNAHHIETAPIEYARRLRAILRRNPNLSLSGMGRKLNKSAAWVRNMLDLLKLAPSVAVCVERGEIPLKSAYLLARVSHKTQEEYLQRAMFMPSDRFAAIFQLVINKEQNHVNPTPRPYLRSLKDINHEISHQEQASVVLTAEGIDNCLDAFIAALRWVIHTDLISLRKFKNDHSTCAN